jgi:hypothetical protein
MRRGIASVAGTMLTAVLAAAALAAPSFQLAMQDGPSPHSQARLISDVTSIQPGQPFTVGLHIALDPGWHTYWVNAGDAGHGVIARWELPAGFVIDSLHYPRPERIPFPPLMSYGYKDEVTLVATVTPPAELAPGTTEAGAGRGLAGLRGRVHPGAGPGVAGAAGPGGGGVAVGGRGAGGAGAGGAAGGPGRLVDPRRPDRGRVRAGRASARGVGRATGGRVLLPAGHDDADPHGVPGRG